MIKRFDILWVNLDPTIGKEIKKTRPCLVISPNELNIHLDTLIVVPLTSTIKKWPFRLTVTINKKVSSLAFDQIRTISKARVGDIQCNLPTKYHQKALNILTDMFSE